MASEFKLDVRIKIAESSESNFESLSPVLKKGEEIVILDPLRRKVGDGTSSYNSLPFDTNHNIVKITEASTLTIYNVVPQTTFFFNRTDSAITDVIFLLDSFKDSNRGFSQCDGRIHKIAVRNTLATTMDVELALSSAEITAGSSLIDIGTVTIAANSFALIEFAWFKASGVSVCCSRIQVSNDIVQDISFLSDPAVTVTNGIFSCYNEERRKYYLLNFNIGGTAMSISLVDYGYTSGTQPSNRVEHYCLVKNISGVTKTVAIQVVGTGNKLVSEGLTSISLANNQSFEFSYIWHTRGSERICVVTKSKELTELTS